MRRGKTERQEGRKRECESESESVRVCVCEREREREREYLFIMRFRNFLFFRATEYCRGHVTLRVVLLLLLHFGRSMMTASPRAFNRFSF